jgi:putative flippase GtrA
MKQMLQFAVAGAVGYLIDIGVLMLVYPWMGAYYGRLLSFACAVCTTWLINRSLTFRHRRREQALHREFSLYFLTTLGGGAVNLACYTLLVYAFDFSVAALPLAVAAGSLAGMLVNYWLSKTYVFTSAPDEPSADA